MGVINDEAMDRAELTLLISEVKYRDEDGYEQKAYKILPWGKVKYGAKGEQQEWVVPVTLSYEGEHSFDYTGLRIKFENHTGIVSADGNEGGLHELGFV